MSNIENRSTKIRIIDKELSDYDHRPDMGEDRPENFGRWKVGRVTVGIHEIGDMYQANVFVNGHLVGTKIREKFGDLLTFLHEL